MTPTTPQPTYITLLTEGVAVALVLGMIVVSRAGWIAWIAGRM